MKPFTRAYAPYIVAALALAVVLGACARRAQPSGAPGSAPPAAGAPQAQASPVPEVASAPQPAEGLAGLPPADDTPLQFRGVLPGDTLATIRTSVGDLTAVLYPEQAPLAVENFVGLAQRGYYKGKLFHRVVSGILAQGGSPAGDGVGGESVFTDENGVVLPFEDEFSVDLWHFSGALSMANAGPGLNLSQFFLVKGYAVDTAGLEARQTPPAVVARYAAVGGMPHLDFRNTVFGQIVEGMDILNALVAVETDENERPVDDVTILDITIETAP